MATKQEVQAMHKLYDQYVEHASTKNREDVEKLVEFIKAVAALEEYQFRNVMAQLIEDIRGIYKTRFVDGPRYEARNQVLRDGINARVAARQNGASQTQIDQMMETNVAQAQVAFETVVPPADYEAARFIGTFTVEFADGEYETLRFRRQSPDSTFMPGRLIVGFLNGPDNTNDFQQFGHVDERGQLRVWRRFTNLENGRKAEAARIVLGGENLDGQREAYAMRSGRCSRCGRVLTVPASLHRGLGPDCAGMV